MKLRFVGLIVLPLFAYIVAPTLVPQPTAAARDDIPLVATFVAWYGYDQSTGECVGGLGSTHWNDSPNTGGVVYRPEPGYYCSADPAVVSWQLDQIEAAGISVLFVSWWGWGDSDLDGDINAPIHADVHMNRGIEALLNDIRQKNRPIRVALIVEPFTLTQASIYPQCPPPEGITSRLEGESTHD